MLNQYVIDKLKQYGIEENDYRVKMGKHRTEEKVGVPYRTIINKDILVEKQADLQMELRNIDSTLCVIFRK